MQIQSFRPDRATRLRRRPSIFYAIIYVVVLGLGIGCGVVGGLLIALRQ